MPCSAPKPAEAVAVGSGLTAHLRAGREPEMALVAGSGRDANSQKKLPEAWNQPPNT